MLLFCDEAIKIAKHKINWTPSNETCRRNVNMIAIFEYNILFGAELNSMTILSSSYQFF